MVGPGVVVVGAGGHALVAIDALRATGLLIAGCVSADGTARVDLRSIDVSMLGEEAALEIELRRRPVDVFVAIGDNRARRVVTQRLVAAGARLARAVDPRAALSTYATVAEGALVMPGAVVNAFVSIGAGAIINTGATVDHECSIGEFAHVAPGVALAGNVTVGEGALVGIGSAVAPGRRIGAWSIVGAGATVIDDVPGGAVVVGTPARKIGGA
jgi:sugar O-acyltransferase (sialic acid O-acetyltransferase NeuD family)